MSVLRRASESLPDATEDTPYDAPDVEYDCKWDEAWDMHDFQSGSTIELDYYSWCIRFWHVFEVQFWAWLETPDGQFAQHLAGSIAYPGTENG